MISITKQCINEILHYTNTALPFESCGIISAQAQNSTLLYNFYPITNCHAEPRHHFEFDKQHWIEVNLKLKINNEHIACYVHSHINADPNLSKEDLNNIIDYKALQLIVHYNEKNSPSLHLYRFNERTSMYENCSLMFA